MGKDPGRVRQLHPQRSFQQMVAETVNGRVQQYIDEQVDALGRGLNQSLMIRMQQQFGSAFLRLRVIEEALVENLPGVTIEGLSNKLADLTDIAAGYTPSNEAAAPGDRVRIEVSTKTSDQSEYQGTSRVNVNNIGSGDTFGSELESAVIGMNPGETREVLFGTENSMQAKITLNRVAKMPKAPAPVDAVATTEASPTEGSDAVNN